MQESLETEQDITLEILRKREQRLQKLLALSGFVLALCLLPLAQYTLVSNKLDLSAKPAEEQGTVAGVSTDSQVEQAMAEERAANGNVPTIQTYASMEACQNTQSSDLTALDSWVKGKKLALARDYDLAVKPYKDALATLDENNPALSSERTALEKLIDLEYQPYLTKLSAVEKAVEKQRQEIQKRDCNQY